MAIPPIKHLVRLIGTIQGLGVAITGVNSNGLVTPSALQATAQPTIDAFDDSDAAQADSDNLVARASAQTRIDVDKTDSYKTHRAEASVLVDELNILREWLQSFKAQVAAATTLADLKTRVAALPDTPDRTLAQAKTALKAAINSGVVD